MCRDLAHPPVHAFSPRRMPKLTHRARFITAVGMKSDANVLSRSRRHDELRDGYRHLTDALPSKVFLLDRATTHIKYSEMTPTAALDEAPAGRE